MNPTEHVIVTLGFHLTKCDDFSLEVIKRGLDVANECLSEADSPTDFRSLMEVRATQIHNVSEEELMRTFK